MSNILKSLSLHRCCITLALCAAICPVSRVSDAADPPTATIDPDKELNIESGIDTEAETASAGEIAEQNLFVIIQQGGLLLYPILFASFILLLFVFERLISLRRRRVIPRPFVRQFLHQIRERSMDQEEALAMCRKNGSPVG